MGFTPNWLANGTQTFTKASRNGNTLDICQVVAVVSLAGTLSPTGLHTWCRRSVADDRKYDEHEREKASLGDEHLRGSVRLEFSMIETFVRKKVRFYVPWRALPWARQKHKHMDDSKMNATIQAVISPRRAVFV